MKNKIGNFLKISIVFFGISLLLWNCERETPLETINLEVDNGNFVQRFVGISEIPKVKQYFEKTIKNNAVARTDNEEINLAIFDEEHILEVIDTLQNANYSFRFSFTDTKLNEFYNLVIGKDANGALQIPFVLKYIADEDNLEEFVASDFNFNHFKGTVSLHKYTDFFELGYFSKTGSGPCPTEFDAVGDPVPCIRNPVSGNASGGANASNGFGTPGTTGAGSGPASGTMGANISLTCTCAGHTETQIGNGGCICPTFIIAINRVNSNEGGGKNRTSADCPPCATNAAGGVGINTVSITSVRAKIAKTLGITRGTAQSNWLNNNSNNVTVLQMHAYLALHADLDGNYTTPSKNFVDNAIDFLIVNPEFNFVQYQNWFGNVSLGLDYYYDEDFWNDPSLTFPSQNLPSWNSFYNAFPRNADGSGWLHGADGVYGLVGGDVLQVRLEDTDNTFTNNTCALKVSIALNGAGIVIPEIITSTNSDGTINYGTIKGANGKYYFLNAQSLNKWMKLTFGTSPANPNHYHYTAVQGGVNGENFPALLGNKKGIYSLTAVSGTTWASGHADILFETLCSAGCHYDGPVESIDVWVLD